MTNSTSSVSAIPHVVIIHAYWSPNGLLKIGWALTSSALLVNITQRLLLEFASAY